MEDIIPICSTCSRPRYGLQQPGITHLQCGTCRHCGVSTLDCACPNMPQVSDNRAAATTTALVPATNMPGHYGDAADEWENLMGMGAKEATIQDSHASYPRGAPGGVWTLPTSSKPYKPTPACSHVQVDVAIGEYNILVTGGHDLTAKDLKDLAAKENGMEYPDLGIYLDTGWKSKLELDKKRPISPSEPKFPKIEAFGGAAALDLTDITGDTTEIMEKYRTAKEQYDLDLAAYNQAPKEYAWPFMWVEWPDRGIIPVEVAERLVTFIRDQLKAGKVIDVGCAGAHGRTGTLLAMLLIDEEGLSPLQAIKQVRKRHCQKAIESEAQVKALFGYGGKLATDEQAKELKSSKW